MPRSRHKPDALRRNAKRLQKAEAFDTMTRIRMLAGTLKNQQQLDTLLLQIPEPDKRQQMFAFVRQFVKFPNPQFSTSTIVSPGLVGPDGRAL